MFGVLPQEGGWHIVYFGWWGRAIGKSFYFHYFDIRNVIDFHKFGTRNSVDCHNFSSKNSIHFFTFL